MGRSAKSVLKIVDELLAKAVRISNGCLISHLAPNAKGYVPVQVGGRSGKKWRAHRLIYVIKVEDVTDEILVRHTCDTRNCIEPNHLIKGTAAQNTQDMMDRGRNRNGGKTKVTLEIFSIMLQLNAKGWTNVAIGELLGLSHETVRAYLNGTFTFPSGDKDSVCV